MSRFAPQTDAPEQEYLIAHNNDYVLSITSTGLETMKNEIKWTSDPKKAAKFTLKQLGEKHYLVVKGYSGTRLVRL